MSAINDSANNGLVYVRVGDSGLIEYNLDPFAFDNAWFEATSPTSKDLHAIVWSGYAFYIFGADGTVLSSVDAEIWTVNAAAEALLTTEDLFGATADINYILACGEAGVIIASFDEGFSWEIIATATSNTLRDIDVAGGQFVAVGDNDTLIVGSLVTDDLDVENAPAVAISETLAGAGVLGAAVSDGLAIHEVPNRGRLYEDTFDQLQGERALFGNTITHEVAGDVEAGVDDSITNLEPSLTEALAMVDNENPIVAGDEGITRFGLITEAFLQTQAILNSGGQFNSSVLDAFTLLSHFPDRYEALAENFTFNETLIGAYHKLLQDGASVNDVPTVNAAFSDVLTEALDMAETPSSAGALSVVVSNQIDLSGATLGNLIYALLVEESTQFGMVLRIGGEVFDAWVANTEHEAFAVTRYTNYNFISMCFGEAGAFATDGTDIYSLEGDDDAGTPISAVVGFAQTDFGTHFRKNVHRAYLGIDTAGEMVLKTTTDEKVERHYRIKSRASGLHNAYAKLGKGVKARYWAFELVNEDGADFELDSIEYVPLLLSKRAR